ncbi:uncharacterized protein LAESUDRAFT_195366 [Laetiporus sulphureus 93-53]|uniref:F-box domain-containing protein n=1 Tax=Laetiporus sulphureus 93-53 TaxID=1314785 RepID=A0A165E183_9APHY|nr:uncharacterized protein LAESUDRAFT_195366 [Laetiporus sulphureus 93-53]KZT06054.1 hypothetical protein LAESUDRAFT_195366 [Laetiporus sulphureus 93-53]
MAAPLGANPAPPINIPQFQLPPEVCERIIDHLDPYLLKGNDDRQTLLNCALVCRGWYTESRAVLFEKPLLRSRKEAVACARSLTRIPLLASGVQLLQIGRSQSDPEIVTTAPELASILVMLAGKLPYLESLEFDLVSFEHCFMRHLAFWSLHEFSHITSLCLSNVTMPSASPFFQVVCSFPHLQYLSCWDLHWSKSRSMAPLPERHRMPLTKVTRLGYDMSCFEDIGHHLLGLLDQAILKELQLHPNVSAATLASTQDILNIVSRRLEEADVGLWARKQDSADGNLQSLLLHPINFEANVNMQGLKLCIIISEMNDVALFVRSVLLPLLHTISSNDLKDVCFRIQCDSELETGDALLNAFDQEACVQIDELLAEGHFAKLRDVSIVFYLGITASDSDSASDDSQWINVCTEICARFPKLSDKNVLITRYNQHQFPSDAERELKAKQLANKQPRPTEQAAA